jgi:hypothetical protein
MIEQERRSEREDGFMAEAATIHTNCGLHPRQSGRLKFNLPIGKCGPYLVTWIVIASVFKIVANSC